jgi:hypothetical protein
VCQNDLDKCVVTAARFTLRTSLDSVLHAIPHPFDCRIENGFKDVSCLVVIRNVKEQRKSEQRSRKGRMGTFTILRHRDSRS